MRLLIPFLIASTILAGCDTNPDLSGFSLTKKLELDETLLTRPKSFQRSEFTVVSEVTILNEYADLEKAYNQCFLSFNGLIDVLEKSNLVVKVPKQAIFMPEPKPESK